MKSRVSRSESAKGRFLTQGQRASSQRSFSSGGETFSTRLSPWVLGAALLVFITGNSACHQVTPIADLKPETHGFAFHRLDAVADSDSRQTVLVGHFFEGDFADLAMVSMDSNGDRVVQFYTEDGSSWSPSVKAQLPHAALFVDVVRIDGRDRLIAGGPEGIQWIDPFTQHHLPVVAQAIEMPSLPARVLPQVDVTEDVNGDGREDLVVPTNQGFWIHLQKEGGEFQAPLHIGHPFDMATFALNIGGRYNPWIRSRIHQIDENGDGRTDLVYWNEDHFRVHRQNEHGQFTDTPVSFTTAVLFDSDDPAYLAAPLGIRQRKLDHQPPGTMEGSVLHSLEDVNGDGHPDLVVFSLHVESMWTAGFEYEVHYGQRNPGGGIEFASEVGARIDSNGLPFGVQALDRDQFGAGSMMFTTLPIGIFKTLAMVVKGVSTKSITMRLEFSCLENGHYSKYPTEIRSIYVETPGVSGERGMHRPSVIVEDVNGDGLAELLMQYGRDELHVYRGVSRHTLFSKRPTRVQLNMPREEFTRSFDFNRDGKQDILMHHQSGIEPDRVTVLIAE
jgi:hypothetical protein